MDFTGLLNGLKEFIGNESAQTRRDILFLTERVGNISGQLDQTNYRLTDMQQQILDTSRRMDDGFKTVNQRIDESSHEVSRRLDSMHQRLDGMHQRLDTLCLTVAPRVEHDAVARRVDALEREVERLKRQSPDTAA